MMPDLEYGVFDAKRLPNDEDKKPIQLKGNFLEKVQIQKVKIIPKSFKSPGN